jgi:hypothetical protein
LIVPSFAPLKLFVKWTQEVGEFDVSSLAFQRVKRTGNGTNETSKIVSVVSDTVELWDAAGDWWADFGHAA